jgi:hypothetical protein
MLGDDLIGIWSADQMYGPGAQSDEVVIFKPDGTGRFEFLNWTLCSADLFRWEVLSPGLLNMVGYRCLELNEDASQVVEASSTFQHFSIAYRIADEDTPSSKRMRVLRWQLPRPYPSHLGFVRRDLAGYEEPRFDVEAGGQG